jgi:hypothetical protein
MIFMTMCKAVPWRRRLVAGLPPRRPGIDPESVHVGFVVNHVALGQVLLRVLRVSPVNFIPPVLHYKEKWKKLIIFITVMHNKPQCCGASVASAAGPFTTKKRQCVHSPIETLNRESPLRVIAYSPENKRKGKK